MIKFEIRKYAKNRRLPFSGMTDEVVDVYEGENNRVLAYAMCPPDCVVFVREP